MLLSPRNTKYKKYHKAYTFNKIKNIFYLSKFNTGTCFKIISKEHGRFSAKQINAVYLLLRKIIKKRGFIVARIFPHTPVTSKPTENRMGKGKGSINFWVANIKMGSPLFEIHTTAVLKRKIMESLRKVQIRIPLLTKIIH